MPAGLGAFLLFVNNLTQVQGTGSVFLPLALAGAAAERFTSSGAFTLPAVGAAAAAVEKFSGTGAAPLDTPDVSGTALKTNIQPAFGPGAVVLTPVAVPTTFGFVRNPYVAPLHPWPNTPSPAAYSQWRAGGGSGAGPASWTTSGPATRASDPWVQRAARVLALLHNAKR